MASNRKSPRILGVRQWFGPDEWAVLITQKQFFRVPRWVHYHMHYFYEPPRHVVIIILAKDELEAMMRFNQLWADLPKEGE